MTSAVGCPLLGSFLFCLSVVLVIWFVCSELLLPWLLVLRKVDTA